MRTNPFNRNLSLFLFLMAWSLPSWSLTIQEALKKVESNESILIAEEEVQISEAQKSALYGGILPDLSAHGTASWRDNRDNASEINNQQLITLKMVQPLWNNFKEFKALGAAKERVQANKLIKEATLRELKEEVVLKYFLALNYQTQIKLNQELYNLSLKRESEIRQRVNIGKSRKSDLLSTQAQSLTVRESIESTKSLLKQALIDLQRILLINDTNIENVENVSSAAPQSYQKEKWLEYPGIKASELLESAYKKNVSIQKSGHYPSLNLEGNYYPYERNTALNNNWDLSLNLSLPIYSGGSTTSKVKEAQAQWKKSRLENQKARLSLIQKIEKLYTEYQMDNERYKLTQQALSYNKQNYEEYLKDYKLSLVNNLDVNTALNQYISNKKTKELLELDIIKLSYQLKVLAGEEI